MSVWLLLILIWANAIEAAHFNGGTVSWAPVYPNTNSTSILITVTQSYSYVYPTVLCTTNIPTSGAGVTLTCVGNCATQNGYSSSPISVLTDCTSYSASLGLVFSQRSVNISLNISTYFWIGYTGSAWRTLLVGGAGWSIVSLINLRRRPDGLINTPPVSQIVSPQYVIVNKASVIKIPVSDVNTDDDLRCRWSTKTGPSGVDECAGICTSAAVTSLANLTGCTLTFTGPIANGWYALALQLEDFINTTSTSPMSSVSVQFLIYVSSPNCSQVPVIIPLTGCLEVQVNVPVTFTLYAMNYCNKTIATITSLIPTVTINGMSVSNLTNSITNTSLVYITLSWTPQASQIGSQQFCAMAYTSERVQSILYCVLLNVSTSIPCATTTTSTTTTTTSTTTDTTTTTTSTETTSTTETSSTTTTETTSTTTTETTSTTTETTTTTTTSETTTTTSETTTSTTTSETTTTTSETTTTTATTTTSTTSETTTTTSTTTTSTTSETTTTTSETTTTTDTTTTTSTTTTTTSTTSDTTTTTTTTETTTTTDTTTTTATTITTTSTTSETTTTATTTTTTTDTTTSATTTTATTTTSATTTTQTTTTTIPSSSETNIPLIVGLSIVALLLAIAFALFWLYRSKWSVAARHRQLFKIKTNLKKEVDTLSDKEDIPHIQSSRKLQNYIAYTKSNTEQIWNPYSPNTPKETKPTSPTNNERINSADTVEVKIITTSSKEENPPIKSHPKQDSSENAPFAVKFLRFEHSPITGSTTEKSPRTPKIVKDNEPNKSTALHHEENEIPISMAKIHVLRLTKNKVSTTFNTRANTDLDPIVTRIRSQSEANDFDTNHITVNYISNQKLSYGSSIFRNNQVSHNDDDDIRKRATSFGGISVHNIKTADNRGKSFVDDGISVNNIKIADNRGKSFMSDGISVNNIRIANSRGKSFMDDGISVSNVRIANSRGKSFMDDGISVRNVRIANSRGKSFIDDGASVSNIRVANSRGKSFVSDGASVHNIRVANSRGKSFVSDGASVHNIRIAKNRDKSFVDAGASVHNVRIANSRSKSFVGDGTSVTNIKLVDRRGKTFVDHPTNSIVLHEELRPRKDQQVYISSLKKEHS